MTLDDLIGQLMTQRNLHGDVDVWVDTMVATEMEQPALLRFDPSDDSVIIYTTVDES